MQKQMVQEQLQSSIQAAAGAEGGAVPVADEMQWYAVQVSVRYEKSVKEKLLQRAEEVKQEHLFKEVLIPCEEIIELKSGEKRKVERLLFPGYIMVQMQMTSETWGIVRRTPNVKGFIGAEARQPLPLTPEEIQSIRDRTAPKESGEVKMETIFEPGEMVRIIEGPFADFSGTVEEVNYAKSNLRVTISIFGRLTPTEVSFNQVVREWA